MEAPIAVARAIRSPYWKAEALASLVEQATDSQRDGLLEEALAARNDAFAEFNSKEIAGKSMVTLAVLADHLEDAERRTVFQKIAKGGGESEARALVALVPKLPEDLLEPALQMAVRLKRGRHEREVLAALLPRLTSQFALEYPLRYRLPSEITHPEVLQALLRSQALDVLWDEIVHPHTPAEVLAPLIPKMPARLLGRALRITKSFELDHDQALALAALALRMRTRKRLEVVFAQARLRAPAYVGNDGSAAFALCFACLGRYDEAIEEVCGIDRTSPARVSTLLELIPRLPHESLPRILALSESLPSWDDQLRVLKALPPEVSLDHWNELTNRLLDYVPGEPKDFIARALAPLLAHLPDHQRPAVWRRIVELEASGSDEKSRYRMLVALGTYFIRDAAHLSRLKLYELMHHTLQLTAVNNQADVLDYLRAIGPLAFALGGKSMVEKIFHVVESFERNLNVGNPNVPTAPEGL
jgi:hypothetical protein